MWKICMQSYCFFALFKEKQYFYGIDSLKVDTFAELIP